VSNDPQKQYFIDLYKMRDDIFNEKYAGNLPQGDFLTHAQKKLVKKIYDQKAFFDAGFDAMLEIIEKEIAYEELTDLKVPKEELF
jgi:hypothetical protein